MPASVAFGLVFLAVFTGANAYATQEDLALTANPIRKVVTMLQLMSKKITAEGEKERELYEKFMCYCKTGGETLAKSIADAEAKIPQVSSDIKEGEAEKKQLEEDIAQAKEDRAAAQAAMKEATAIREKEAAAYAKEHAELLADIDAMTKAIAALEKGMTGGFLQTSSATVLRRLAVTVNLGSADREILTSFLTERADSGYAPQSGEIVGILKQMRDTMEATMKEAKEAEEEAIRIYEELMAAKTKEVAVLTKQIEEKLVRLGELGVELVNMREDLDDTAKSLEEDKKFLADLDNLCEEKKKDWEYRSNMRAQELVAIAETIKILNDDDALELFKKTLPSASLLQMRVGAMQLRQSALQALEGRHGQKDPRVGLIALALRGKSVTFEKVIKMIDDMVILLGKEQIADDEKKAMCEVDIDRAEDEIKELEYAVKTLEKNIEDATAAVATLTDEIAALTAGIEALDKSVTEATETRKEEHEDFVETMAADNAAVQILGIAKNRLNKFYNPVLHKPAPKRELSEDERITLNFGGTLAPTQPPAGIAGTGVTALSQTDAKKDAPPPPPETYGAYAKKGEESGGVIAMIDLLIKDLENEITTMTAEEKAAQEDYAKFMVESADKRAADTQSIVEKEGAKAGLEGDLQKMGEEKKAKLSELMATEEYLHNLHLDCDWLLKNFVLRKEARAGEVDALKKAKAILSGADYSLAQVAVHTQQRQPRAGF